MPCRPRWSALTFVTTATSLCSDPDAAKEHAAARGLEHRDVGLLGERHRRAAEPA